jgi:TP901 family phage tail tape measure protein/lambda family phage tail tape measure protein
MALKNRDLTFIIKVQNQAKAALKALQGDLRGTGAAGKEAADNLTKTAAAINKLKSAAGATTAVVNGITKVRDASKRTADGVVQDGARQAASLKAVAAQAEASAKKVRDIKITGGGSPTPATNSSIGSRTNDNQATLAASTQNMRTPPGSAAAGAAAAASLNDPVRIMAAAKAAREAAAAIAGSSASTTRSTGILSAGFEKVRGVIDQVKDSAATLRARLDAQAASGERSAGVFRRLSDAAGRLPPVLKTIAAFTGFSILSSGLRLIGAAIAAPVTSFIEFEAQMKRVQAVAQATDAQLKPLSTAALDLSRNTTFGAVDAGAALQNLIQNGLTAAQSIKVLRPAADFATVGQLTLAESADTLTKTLAQYQLGVQDAAHATDVLNFINVKTNTDIKGLASSLSYAGSVANAFKIGLAETTAVIGVLGDAGIKGSAGGTAVRSLLLDLSELANGIAPKKAQQLLANLKLDPAKIDPSKVGLTKALAALKEAKLTVAELNVLFQKRGATPASILLADKRPGQTQSALDKASTLTSQAEGPEAKDFNKKQAEIINSSLAARIEKMKNAFKGFAIAIGSTKSPLSDFIGGITDVVNRGTDFINFLQGSTVDAYNTVEAFKALAVGALAAGGAVAGVAVAGALAGGGLIGLAGGVVVATLAVVDFTIALLANPMFTIPALVAVCVAAFYYFANSIQDSGGKAVTGFTLIKATWAGVVAYFFASLSALGKAFSDTFSGIGRAASGGIAIFSAVKAGDPVALAAAVAKAKSGISTAVKGLNLDVGKVGGDAYNAAFAKTIKDAPKIARRRGALAPPPPPAALTPPPAPDGGDTPNRFGGGGGKKRTGKSDAEKQAEEDARLAQGRHDLLIKENLDLLAQEGLIGAVGIAREKFTKTTEFLNKVGLKGIDVGKAEAAVKAGNATEDQKLTVAIIARTTALVDAQRVDKIAMGIYDDATDAQIRYNDTLAASIQLLKDHPEAQRAATEAVNKAKIALDNYLDPLKELKDQTRDLIALSNVRASALEIEAKVQEVYNKAIADGADAASAAARAAEARPEFAKQAAAQARIDLKDTIAGIQEQISLAGVLEGDRDRVTEIVSYQNSLTKAGITDQAEINRLVGIYADKLDDLKDAQKTARNDFVAGAREGLQSVSEQFNNLRKSASDLVTNTFDNVSDQLQNFLKGGKFSIKSVISSLGQDMIKEGVNGLLGNAAGALNNALGGNSPLKDLAAKLTGKQNNADPAKAAGDKLGTDLTVAFTTTTTGVTNTGLTFTNNLATAYQGIVAGLQAVQPGASGGIGGVLSGSTGIGGGSAAIGGLGSGLFGATPMFDTAVSARDTVSAITPAISAALSAGAPGGGLMGTITSILGAGGGMGGAAAGGGLLGIAGQILKGSGGGAGMAGLAGLAVSVIGPQITNLFQSILGKSGVGGAISGFLGGGILGAARSIFKFSEGGIMTDRGNVPLRKYSGGGIASSPQLAMFGEGSAPEAYVPVPSGRIPVNIKGGGGGGQTNITHMTINTPDANSFRRSKGQIASQMAGELSRQAKRNN